MSNTAESLKKINLFSFLSNEQLDYVAQLVIERFYKAGRIIFFENEPGEAVFFLKSGRIKVTKADDDGREQILHFVHPGEMFAEVVLWGDSSYPATAEVIEDAEVQLIRNQDMERLILEHPDIALGFLKIMAQRLRFAQRQINELALMSTTRRMASMLLYLAADQGKKTNKGIKIDISLTKQDLASLIGTSRETANRILSDFKKQRAIEVDRQEIIIIDKDKLKTWI
jgi:CRP/FNR family transcriptional regulator